jgi:hypothetical protein
MTTAAPDRPAVIGKPGTCSTHFGHLAAAVVRRMVPARLAAVVRGTERLLTAPADTGSRWFGGLPRVCAGLQGVCRRRAIVGGGPGQGLPGSRNTRAWGRCKHFRRGLERNARGRRAERWCRAMVRLPQQARQYTSTCQLAQWDGRGRRRQRDSESLKNLAHYHPNNIACSPAASRFRHTLPSHPMRRALFSCLALLGLAIAAMAVRDDR